MQTMGDARQQVLDVQHALWDGLKAKDAAAWERILADDFVYRSPGEEDKSKAEFIAHITSFQATITSITSHDLRVDIFDKVAVVTGVQCARVGLASGFQLEDFMMLNNIFVQRAGQWQLVLSHTMNLPT